MVVPDACILVIVSSNQDSALCIVVGLGCRKASSDLQQAIGAPLTVTAIVSLTKGGKS